MKALIISDTHGSLAEVKTIVERESPLATIIHAGDVLYHGPRNPLPKGYTPADLATFLQSLKNIVYVRGNCDADVDQMVLGLSEMPRERIVDLGSYRIYVCHGDRETATERLAAAKQGGAEIVVSGHVHISVLKREDGIVVLNPGSTTLPKDGTASYGLLDGHWLYLKAVRDGRILASIDLTLL